jgi:hypothetical protein
VLAAISPGCARLWNQSRAPQGYSIVRDQIISAPRNLPPIETNFVYSILEVDGSAPVPEWIPPFVDALPGAKMTAGHHKILAKIKYFPLPKDIDPKTSLPVIPAAWRESKEIVFEKDLSDGVVYYLVGNAEGNPELIANNPRDK